MKYKVTLTILMSSDLKFPHHSINQNFKFHVAASLKREKGTCIKILTRQMQSMESPSRGKS